MLWKWLALVALFTAGLAGCTQFLTLPTQPPADLLETPRGDVGSAPSPSPSSAPTSSPVPSNAPTPLPTLTATLSPTPEKPIRAIRLDYGDYSASRAQVQALEQNMKVAGVNLVALGAGRAEWTYFKWAGRETAWSSDVMNSGIDFLAEDAQRFSQWARVDAVVDVYAPRYIKEHPDKAALSWLGQPSPYLVNTVELVDGEYGRMLLDMIEAIAANYPVDSISITELMYYTDGYSEADRQAYMAYSGNKDWPRLKNGLVNIDHSSIGEWRSYEIARFLAKARVITTRHGKKLYIDAAVSWDSLDNLGEEKGTRYDVLLKAADRVIVWDYFALNGYKPEYTLNLAQALQGLDVDRLILSVGLWAKNGQVISPEELSRALAAAQQGGIRNLWITPSLLLSEEHWRMLNKVFPSGN